MGRAQEEMVNNLEEIRPSHVAFVHLTRGLFARNTEFNKQPIKLEPGKLMSNGIVFSQNEFQVHEDMQRAIAHIRNDLDSFSEVETNRLEADAYQMAECPLKNLLDKYFAKKPFTVDWRFTHYSSELSNKDSLLLKHRKVASRKFFKPLFHLFTGTTGVGKAALGLFVVSIPLVISLSAIAYLFHWALQLAVPYSIWRILTDRSVFQPFMYDAAPAIYALLTAFILSILAAKFIQGSGKRTKRIREIIKSPMSFIKGIMIRLILPAIFAIPLLIYLYTIDAYFVRVIGKLK